MKRIIVSFCIFLTFLGCTSESSKVEYVDISKIEKKASTTNVLNSDLMLKYPAQIEKVDTFLVIMDLVPSEYYLQLYTTSGKFIMNFCKRGNGPGEVSSARNFSTNESGEVAVYDNGRMFYYDLNKMVSGKEDPMRMEQLNLPPYPLQNAVPVKDGYLYIGFTDKMRFFLRQKGQKDYFSQEYPTDLGINDNAIAAAVATYAQKISLSPDKKHLAQGTYIGASLNLFQIKGGGLESPITIPIIPAEFSEVGGGAVSWNDNTIIGFDDLSASSTCIYTLLSKARGINLKKAEGDVFAKDILVFSWEGKPLYEVNVGQMLICLTVDEANKKAYSVNYSAEGYALISISWK